MAIDLSKFCAQVGDPRSYLHKPFALEGGAAACDGNIVVLAEGERAESDGKSEIVHSCTQLMAQVRALIADETRAWVPVADITLTTFPCDTCAGDGFGRALEDCEDCDGEGTFAHGTHCYDCKECDGTGEVNGERDPSGACATCYGTGVKNWPTDFVLEGFVLDTGSSKYSAGSKYVALLQRYAPNARLCRTATSGKSPGIAIAFDGGVGLLMPMRD